MFHTPLQPKMFKIQCFPSLEGGQFPPTLVMVPPKHIMHDSFFAGIAENKCLLLSIISWNVAENIRPRFVWQISPAIVSTNLYRKYTPSPSRNMSPLGRGKDSPQKAGGHDFDTNQRPILDEILMKIYDCSDVVRLQRNNCGQISLKYIIFRLQNDQQTPLRALVQSFCSEIWYAFKIRTA